MAADRAAFIDQSHSLNIHMRAPTMGKLTSMHFYGWKKGLKTGMYYLRTQAASAAIQFTIDKSIAEQAGLNISSLPDLIRPQYVPHKVNMAEKELVPKIDGAPSLPFSYETKRETSPTLSTTSSVANSIASLKIQDSQPVTPVTSAPKSGLLEKPTKFEKPADNEQKTNDKKNDEFDIFSSKVIACAINNPESCTMCSG